MQEIIKSPNDTRKSYTYNLPNNLRVVIINDDNADMSCVSMLVKVGFFQDTVPGIAHFLEHMLFNGTEKFPEEKYFSEYISKYNGYQNAYTSHDHTCYFYSVAINGLLKSLEIFSNFFIAPKLNKDGVNREKEAVDSEHKKNINNDLWRSRELLKLSAKENHCFRNFGSGSNATLSLPNIHVKVREFFDRYYSPDIMTLVVLTKDDVSNVKKIIDINFSQIPTRKNNIDDEIKTAFEEKILQTPKIIRYLPILETNTLILNWEIPYYRNDIKNSPLEFLIFLLGNKQKNSLNDILQKKKYITSDIGCYISDIIYDRCILCIDINLSDIGNKNTVKKEIMNMICEYVELLFNNITQLKDLFDERIIIQNYDFLFFKKNDNIDAVLKIAETFNDYIIDPTKIFTISIMQNEYTKQLQNNLRHVLTKLTLENVVIISGSKKYNTEKYVFSEYPHYGTKYNIETSSYEYDRTILKEHIKIPTLNKFISVSEKINKYADKMPKLMQENGIDLYYMQNTKFNTPDVCVVATIFIHDSLKDLFTEMSTILYISSIIRELLSDIYMLFYANYSCDFSYNNGSINIYINGNYEKIISVCNFIIDALINEQLITENSFDMTKTILKKKYTNDIYKSAFMKVNDVMAKHIFTAYHSPEDKLNIIDTIKISDVINVFKNVIKKNKIILFVCGNCTQELVLNVKNVFDKISCKENSPDFGCGKHYDISKYNDKLYKKPNTNVLLKVTNKYNDEQNNAHGYHVYIDKLQFSKNKDWKKTYCLLHLLDNIISPEYFDELRTKEMYGYVVKSSIVEYGEQINKIFTYLFLVQSPHKTTDEITERTELFIKNMADKLKKLTEEDFAIVKQSYISKLNSDYNNLTEMADFIYTFEIKAGYLEYDFKKAIIKCCEKLSINDLLKFYNDKFIENRKATIIHVDKK